MRPVLIAVVLAFGMLLPGACSDSEDAATSTADAAADAALGAGGADAALVGDANPDAPGPGPDAATPDVPTQPDVPSPVDGDGVEFLDVAIDGTGFSAPLSFELPEDAVSFSITVVGPSEVWAVVHDMTGPTGQVLMGTSWHTSPTNQGGAQLCVPCVNRVSGSSGAVAALVPISPSVTVAAGNYTFGVASFTSESNGFSAPTITAVAATVDVFVDFKRGKPLAATGTLDLNLFFTGAGGIQAATAMTDNRITDALALMREIYGKAGITIGEVRTFDMDAQFQVIEGIFDPGNDFEAASAQTADAPPGVNLIFVREISEPSSPFGGFGVILGVSGGIPGPVLVQGSGRSAVIVDIDVPADGQGGAPIGATMAHEVGHYLGLFHSSEFLNQLHDPLPDTPQGDATNLMYFEGSSGGNNVTADQGTVMRSNPWVW